MKVAYRVERVCPNGWEATGDQDCANGGHFCDRKAGHAGRCRCPCGTTSTTRPPPGWVGSGLADRGDSFELVGDLIDHPEPRLPSYPSNVDSRED